jgi:hypothetical protein
VVRDLTDHGLSERRALAVVGMSASSLRYTPAPDRNEELRAQIVALAHRHRRYGAGMVYLKLRQAGKWVNHKRVERLYTEACLQVRRRRRKKIRSRIANYCSGRRTQGLLTDTGGPYVPLLGLC